MNWGIKLYFWLLKGYPKSYLTVYGDAMADAFEQQYSHEKSTNSFSALRFWTFIAKDLIMTVPKQHLSELKAAPSKQIYLGLLALAVGAWLGWVGLHSTDIGVVAGLLLISSLVFGFLGKRKPWIWALVIGMFVPLLGLFAAFFHIRVSGRERNEVIYWYTTYGEVAQMMMSLVFTSAGAYPGYACRNLFSLIKKQSA